MREEDTHKVSCQMAFAAGEHDNYERECSGAGCAAWQWINEKWEHGKPLNTKDDAGYCGMAGISINNLIQIHELGRC